MHKSFFESLAVNNVNSNDNKSYISANILIYIVCKSVKCILIFRHFLTFLECNENPMEILPLVNHIWEDNVLRISWPPDFRPDMRFGSLVSTCSCLTLDGHSSISVISSLIGGNCYNLKVRDSVSGNEDLKTFSSDIVDFLYSPSINGSPVLCIQTNGRFSLDVFEELINKIRSVGLEKSPILTNNSGIFRGFMQQFFQYHSNFYGNTTGALNGHI